MKSIPAAAVLAVSVFLAGPALGQKSPDQRGTWSFTLENDIIAGTDRDYTNGALISYVSPANDLPFFADWAPAQLTWLTKATKWHMTYGIGQNMYTPQDIAINPPDAADRPYAGFLYGTIGLVADERHANGEPRHLDVLALDVGIVGKHSLAEQTQKLVHRVIDDQKPLGWDSQLGTEVGVRLLYERSWRASQKKWDVPIIPLEGDITPYVGAALGNIETYGTAGVSFRLGEDLGDDYGPPRVRPALSGPGFFKDVDGFSWYVFGGVAGRAVARDLFVEGNTFKDSAGVKLVPFQLDLQAGVAIQIGRVELAFTHVIRSPQHTKQDRWSRFGSINLRTQF